MISQTAINVVGGNAMNAPMERPVQHVDGIPINETDAHDLSAALPRPIEIVVHLWKDGLLVFPILLTMIGIYALAVFVACGLGVHQGRDATQLASCLTSVIGFVGAVFSIGAPAILIAGETAGGDDAVTDRNPLGWLRTIPANRGIVFFSKWMIAATGLIVLWAVQLLIARSIIAFADDPADSLWQALPWLMIGHTLTLAIAFTTSWYFRSGTWAVVTTMVLGVVLLGPSRPAK
ncbi:MAG: hypothetical protein AAFP69_16055, partial [Planctomycetota bacterium]